MFDWFDDVWDSVTDIFDGGVDIGDPLGYSYDDIGNAVWGGGGSSLLGDLGGKALSAIGSTALSYGASALAGSGATGSRSSATSRRAATGDYPAAASQKAGDAGTPRGLRSVDPDTLSNYWKQKMTTLSAKYQ